MPLQITGRHVDVTARQRAYIEKKIARLRKHFEKIDEMAVTIAVENRDHVVEISFRAGSIHAFTKSSDQDALAAIDKAVNKIESQIARAKDKRFGNKKHPRQKTPASARAEELEGELED